jgi:hypothetical protein
MRYLRDRVRVVSIGKSIMYFLRQTLFAYELRSLAEEGRANLPQAFRYQFGR